MKVSVPGFTSNASSTGDGSDGPVEDTISLVDEQDVSLP